MTSVLLLESGRDKKRIENQTQTRAGHASLRHSPAVILVIDDEASIRQTLGDVLRLEEYEVRLASDGREGVRSFLEGPPDLILLDLSLPDINGWQVFQIMGEMYPFVPVIVITAHPGQSHRAAELGIDMLMEKPLDIPTLLAHIRRLLARPDTAHLGKVLHVWRTGDLLGTQE